MEEQAQTFFPPTVEAGQRGEGTHRLLLELLHDNDVPCPVCRYNLRGITSERCPECGIQIRLTIGAAEPYPTAWVALAMISSISAGVGLLCLSLMLGFGWPGVHASLLAWTSLYFICSIAFPLLVLATRRPFIRLRHPMQKILLVAAAGILIATLTLLFRSLQ